MLQRINTVSFPTKVYLKDRLTLRETLHDINHMFPNLLEVTCHGSIYTWKINNPVYLVILSDALSTAMDLAQNVITPWDKSPKSCSPVKDTQRLPPNQYLMIIPTLFTHQVHTIRKLYEPFSRERIFNTLSKYMDITYDANHITVSPRDPTKLYVFSKGLHFLAPFHQAGFYLTPVRHRWSGFLHYAIDESYKLAIYPLDTLHVLR